jgi:ribosomal protein S18 acetylase RimI-like enzyme
MRAQNGIAYEFFRGLVSHSMRLRSFRSADLGKLHEIDLACFAPGISYAREELERFISHPNSQTWVAEEAREIVGFLIANREPRKIMHIVTIDVVAAWRRRGIGELLMDAAEQWAKDHGLGLIRLETAQDNLGAQRFYEGRGYQKVDKVEGYYADGTAAWVMVKELS